MLVWRTSGSSTISRRKASISPSYSRWTVHATKARWFGDVQASVAKWRWPGCSRSNLAIRSRHFSKLAWMSFEMTGLVGSWMLGRPAVKRFCNSLSLMMLMGRLFSVSHLTRCALHLIVSGRFVALIYSRGMYRTSGFVWTRCEYFTGCLPLRAKSAKIPRLWLVCSFPAIAALTASSPKQRRVWCLRFAVEALSFESW